MMFRQLVLIALFVQVALADKSVKSTKKAAEVTKPAPPASRSLNLFPNLLSFFGLNRPSKISDHVYTVIKVSDGDTITIKNRTSNQLVKVRFL
jgi:hypothetical protein